MQEMHRDMLAVNLAVEIEQMHFQNGLNAVTERRPNAEAGGARQMTLVEPTDRDREDAL